MFSAIFSYINWSNTTRLARTRDTYLIPLEKEVQGIETNNPEIEKGPYEVFRNHAVDRKPWSSILQHTWIIPIGFVILWLLALIVVNIGHLAKAINIIPWHMHW